MNRRFPQFLVLFALASTVAVLSRQGGDGPVYPQTGAVPHPLPYRVVSHDWVEAAPRKGLPVVARNSAACAAGCKNCALMVLTDGGFL